MSLFLGVLALGFVDVALTAHVQWRRFPQEALDSRFDVREVWLVSLFLNEHLEKVHFFLELVDQLHLDPGFLMHCKIYIATWQKSIAYIGS